MSLSSETISNSLRPPLLLLALILASCSGNFKHVKFDSHEKTVYVDDLISFRQEKDNFFKTAPESPLTSMQKTTFERLNYYPPNLDLVFHVKLLKNANPKHIGIEATGGETRPAEEYGRLQFQIDGKNLELHVYKMLGDDSNELFVPFTDETCGNTSYAGGRYIDMSENHSGEYTLDFNYAYNPYCAYSHNFSCPIVPKENHLDVPVKAGEMKFSGQ